MEQGITSLSTSTSYGNEYGNHVIQPKHKVFLSHSGAQKEFAEQLCVDLERCNRRPFFERRMDSLPIGKNFPSLIFEAIEQCEVGVVVLSEESFSSKWPMLELVAMTNVQKRKPSFTIIPILFRMTLSQCRDANNHKRWLSSWHRWAESDSRMVVKDWENALQLLCRTTALQYHLEFGEVELRREIVKVICALVRPEARFEDSLLCEGAAGGQSSGAAGDRASAGQFREPQRAAEVDASRRRLVRDETGSGASNAPASSKHRRPGHEESAKDSPPDHVRRQLQTISRIQFSMENRAEQMTICPTQIAHLVKNTQYQVARLWDSWDSEWATELRLDQPLATVNWDPIMFLLDRFICCMVAAEDLLSICAEEDWMTAAFSLFLPACSKFAIVTRDLDCASDMLVKLLIAAVDPKCSGPNEKSERNWMRRCIEYLSSFLQLTVQELLPEDDSLEVQIMTDDFVSDRKEALTKLESGPRQRSLELEVYESVLRKRLDPHVISDVSGLVPYSFWIPEKPPYVIEDVAGTGSSKTVLKCAWLEHQVAIAVYKGVYAKSDLEAEAGILARVQHPNVVTFIGCAYEDKDQKGYLVTELMEQDLGELIRKSRRGEGEMPFSLSVTQDIILQIVEALVHMRKCRVLHRDLKPQNCLVNMKKSGVQEDVGHNYYVVKLIDFGSAKLQGPDMSIAHTRKQGSTAYMAPEVHALKDACQYTWSADVYSFGMTFYEIISGQYPFEGVCKGGELADRACAGGRPLFPKSCPVVWKLLIEKCWHQNPKRRPTFRTIRKELMECCGKLAEN